MALKRTPNSARQTATQQPSSETSTSQPASSGLRVGTVVIDNATVRKYVAELIGTGLLVFFGAGMATVTFGFRAFGTSAAAGILLTGLTFGLVLLGLVAVIGPISDCHVNPAVTLGAFLTRRISGTDLVGYWFAQLLGGLLGALLLLWVMRSSPFYSTTRVGLGANGYGPLSLLHSSGGGAFLIEVVLTAVFVLVVLAATRRDATASVAGVVVALTLALVNIMGIPIDGASVNPARSFGPAVIVGGLALSQLWLFLISPLVGAMLGVGVYVLLQRLGGNPAAPDRNSMPATEASTPAAAAEPDVTQAEAAGPAETARPVDPPADNR
jgi:aquaporin Z